MVKSRSRQSRDDLIIRTKKNWFIETILTILSLFIWCYVIFAILFYMTTFFNLPLDQVNILKIILNLKNHEIIQFALNICYFTLLVTIILYLWGMYNKLRYGRLNRRKYPEPTTIEEIMALNFIQYADYQDLQSHKFIVFEKNPIHDESVKTHEMD